MTTPPGEGAGDAPRRRALGELGLVGGGKLASIVSLVLSNLLVARWAVDGGEYGRYAAGISLALILDAAIGFPMDISTVRFAALHPAEPQRVDRLQAAALRCKLLVGALLFAVAALGGEPLSRRLLGEGASPGVIAAVILCTIALLLVRSTSVRLQVQGQFSRYAVLDGIHGTFRLLALLGPLLLGQGSAAAFLLAQVAGSMLAFAAGFWLAPHGYLRLAWPERRDVREAVVHTGFMAGIVVLGTLTGRADVPILAARSAEEAGHYAVALQVATMLTMLATVCSVVLQPRIIRMADAGKLGVLVRWNVAGAAVVSVVTAAAAAWILPTLIPWAFGDRYAPAVAITAVLLIGTCADLFLMPVLMMFSIQVFPAASLVGESVIALGFFGAVVMGIASETMAMAWLVTGVRLVKLLLYAGITWWPAARGSRPKPELTA